MQARKYFGQHFLHDQYLVGQIISSVNPQAHENILEIGPGHGALTAPLIASHCRLAAIEIDRNLARALKAQYSALHIIEADALTFDLSQLVSKTNKLRIIGNLPYNISTPLLFRLFAHIHLISDMHFMLQREVVDRITSAPATKSYGRLAVMSQYYCQGEKLFEVPPSAFTPKPQVMSAVIRLLPKSRCRVADNLSTFREIVSQAFSMRRKTLRNALKTIISPQDMAAIGIDPTLRPENLSPEDYIALANLVHQMRASL